MFQSGFRLNDLNRKLLTFSLISFIIITTDQIEKDEINEKEIIIMPVDIKNVLVCDAVDDSCIQLLKQNGINVIFSIVFA